jgi:alpha-maltose-1-phosphate synthase
MVTSEFPPITGGVGQYVSNLSQKMKEREHDVTVITRKRIVINKRKQNSGLNSSGFFATDLCPKEYINGVLVHRVPYYPFFPMHASILTLSVNRLLRSLEKKFDIVHVHTPMPLPVITSIPLITTVHTPMLIDSKYHETVDLKSMLEKMQSSYVYPPLESSLFKISQKITAVSRTVAAELSYYGVDSSSVDVLNNGVNSQIFYPRKLGTPSSEKYILYVGVLRARKGLFDLIECAAILSKIRPSVKFIICGSGPLKEKIIRVVKEKGLEKQVIFPGWISRTELIRLIQNATIQVIPSHYEGLPTVLLEAMACGLPVVATNIGGNNEVIKSGVNGLLIPAKQPNLMARALLKLLDDPLLRENLGVAARKTILSNFTWDKVADKILNCYKEIA